MSPRPWMSATIAGDARRQREEGVDRHRLDPRVDRADSPAKVLQLEGGQTLKARQRQWLDDRQALELRPISYSWRSCSTSGGRLALRVEHLENHSFVVEDADRPIDGALRPLLQPLTQRVGRRRGSTTFPAALSLACSSRRP